VRMLASFCCELGRKASISRCARTREREQDQREGAGYQWIVGIDKLLWLFLRAPVGDSVCLTTFQRGKKSERGEEEVGELKEGLREAVEGSRERGHGRGRGAVAAGVGWGLGMNPTGELHLS
jgi:hypothetical protein